MSGVSFRENKATTFGGAIYSGEGSTLSIEGSKFTNNRALTGIGADVYMKSKITP
jgi:predicted outer membrane repeat protein